MSKSDFEGFVNELQKNAGFREEFDALGRDPEAWVRWANAKGFRFTREDADRLAESRDLDISDDDLENVAGGWCGNELTTGG